MGFTKRFLIPNVAAVTVRCSPATHIPRKIAASASGKTVKRRAAQPHDFVAPRVNSDDQTSLMFPQSHRQRQYAL
jgi:hypothetical protein